MSREFIKDIKNLTNRLSDEAMFITPQSSTYIPNRDVVIDILKDLREALFPVQFSKADLTKCTIDYYIGSLLLKIEQALHKQIGIALMRREEYYDFGVSQEVADRAAELSVEFMNKLPHIRRLLMMDIEAFFEGDPAAKTKDEIILSYPGMFAIFVHRLAHELYKVDIPILPRMMSEYAHAITGVDINPGAEIGHYFFIDHATGVVIGETCKIANHVKIYQGVTLGALSTKGGQSLSGKKRHPTIEDDVTIYANATVLGGDTVIGKGAVIGGSCFITESIPAGAQVSTISDIILKQKN